MTNISNTSSKRSDQASDRVCFLSIDVEKKEETGSFEGVEKLDNILNIFRKYRAKATLFVTGEVLEHYSDLVKKWAEDFEIGCHNFYHVTLDKIDIINREKQLRDFMETYARILGKKPKGFRAPRNIIDNQYFEILEKHGFNYDSSVLPRYPLGIKHYAGYRGRAPIKPYWPDNRNYRKHGSIKVLEIPEAPAFFGIPLVGTWLRKMGVEFFKFLFFLKKPEFISFSMHSWDGVGFTGKGSKNSGKIFLKQLDEMLGFLKKIGYEFRSGEEIFNKIQKSKIKTQN